MKRRILGTLLAVLILLSSSATCLAFNKEQDASKYQSVRGTQLYEDPNARISDTERADVIKFYNLIPSTMRGLMVERGIKVFLISEDRWSENLTYTPNTTRIDKAGLKKAGTTGDSREVSIKSLGSAADGLYFYCDSTVEGAPLYLEEDPYNLNNLRVVSRDGKKYLLVHGCLIDIQNNEKNVNWDFWKQRYLDMAPEWGVDKWFEDVGSYNVVSQEDSIPEVKGSSAVATSWGPSVEYDSNKGYSFCRFVKDGWTEYYAGNAVYVPESVIHEAGHMLDWYSVPLGGCYKFTLFGISDSQEWQTLYKKYSAGLAGVDALSSMNVPQNVSEGFADAFRLTYQYPEKMRSEFKEVYEFVLRKTQQYTGVGSVNTFDATDYAERYPDVKEALGTDKNVLWNHFSSIGVNEGRVAKFF